MYRRRITRHRAPARRTRRRVYRRRTAAPRRRTYVRRRAVRRRPIRRFGRRRAPGTRTVMRTRPMHGMTMRNGDIVIEHMEYIGDLIPSTNQTFLAQVYPIQPALSSTFPFISGIACQYEMYDPTHMTVILKSTSGNAFSSVNAATGSMGCTVLYNVYTPTSVVNNKVIAEGYEGATSGNPNKSQICRINCKHNRNPLETFFARTGAVPAGQTLNLTDICNLVVWSSGLQTTTASAIAEIWIKYRIVFKSPRPFSGQLGYNIITAQYTYSSNLSATPPATGNWWGGAGSGGTTTFQAAGTNNAMLVNSNNNLPLLFSQASNASAFQFPAGLISGSYVILFTVTGTSAAGGGSSGAVTATPTNCALSTIVSGTSNTPYLCNGTQNYTSDVLWQFGCFVQLQGPGAASVSFNNNATWPTTVTKATLIVTQINGAITTVT